MLDVNVKIGRSPSKPICRRCGKFAHEIPEYQDMAQVLKTTPDEYVLEYETTLEPRTMRFLCSDCFVKAGYPIRTASGGIAYG